MERGTKYLFIIINVYLFRLFIKLYNLNTRFLFIPIHILNTLVHATHFSAFDKIGHIKKLQQNWSVYDISRPELKFITCQNIDRIILEREKKNNYNPFRLKKMLKSILLKAINILWSRQSIISIMILLHLFECGKNSPIIEWKQAEIQEIYPSLSLMLSLSTTTAVIRS